MTGSGRKARRLAGLAAAFLLASCAMPPPPLPAEPVPAGPAIGLTTTPVPLNPEAPSQERIGDFAYAGGLAITSESSLLHGLSDLKILPDGTLLAVTDAGDLFEARLRLDANERLTGLTDGKLWRLKGLDGAPLGDKEAADAEGLAVLPSGDRLVSFERDHRIWLYPAGGGAPRPAPSPNTLLSYNEGLEALTQYPTAGHDAYLVGSEEGETWLCRLAGACARTEPPTMPGLEFGLTAMAAFEDGTIAYLARAYDPARGSRIRLRVVSNPLTAAARPIGALALDAPLTRDNFEGLAAVRNAAGGARFYLLSDDNFSASQRTLLLAFDWVPRP